MIFYAYCFVRNVCTIVLYTTIRVRRANRALENDKILTTGADYRSICNLNFNDEFSGTVSRVVTIFLAKCLVERRHSENESFREFSCLNKYTVDY